MCADVKLGMMCSLVVVKLAVFKNLEIHKWAIKDKEVLSINRLPCAGAYTNVGKVKTS